jgi:hypothetical protein
VTGTEFIVCPATGRLGTVKASPSSTGWAPLPLITKTACARCPKANFSTPSRSVPEQKHAALRRQAFPRGSVGGRGIRPRTPARAAGEGIRRHRRGRPSKPSASNEFTQLPPPPRPFRKIPATDSAATQGAHRSAIVGIGSDRRRPIRLWDSIARRFLARGRDLLDGDGDRDAAAGSDPPYR